MTKPATPGAAYSTSVTADFWPEPVRTSAASYLLDATAALLAVYSDVEVGEYRFPSSSKRMHSASRCSFKSPSMVAAAESDNYSSAR